MAVAVAQFQRPQEFRPEQEQKIDPMDQILKGLQIASTVYGIKHNIDQNDLNKLQQTKVQQDLTAQETLMKTQGEDLAAQKDPSSQQSSLARMYAQKYSGQQIPDTATAYDLRNIVDPKKLIETEASGKASLERSMQLEDLKSKGQQATQAAKFSQEEKMAKLKGSEAQAKGKTLPPATVESLASSNASLQALEAANKAMQGATVPTGPFMGRVSGLMGSAEVGETGKGAKALDAQLKLNAQTIGKYLEGGKLTDMDIDRYKQMLPSLTDSPQAAAEKTKLLQTLISNKQQSEIEGLTQAGYDVGRIKLYTPNLGQSGGQPAQVAPKLDLNAIEKEIIRRKGLSAGIGK